MNYQKEITIKIHANDAAEIKFKRKLNFFRIKCNLFFLFVDGLALFAEHLESEFSQENIQFWEACEHYRKLPAKAQPEEAQRIYQTYLSVQSPREVR